MNDKPQIKLSETVVLIDAAFLNFVITDMKGYFEDTLQRSLQEIDLSILTTYLTLDAGITEGKNEVQFLFVYDKESGRLVHCRPSDLEKELNGVAFQSPYGEYSFASVPSEGMVTREDLFLDLLSCTIFLNEEYSGEDAGSSCNAFSAFFTTDSICMSVRNCASPYTFTFSA